MLLVAPKTGAEPFRDGAFLLKRTLLKVEGQVRGAEPPRWGAKRLEPAYAGEE